MAKAEEAGELRGAFTILQQAQTTPCKTGAGETPEMQWCRGQQAWKRFLRVALLPQEPGAPSPQFFPALSGYSGEGGRGLKGKTLLYQGQYHNRDFFSISNNPGRSCPRPEERNHVTVPKWLHENHVLHRVTTAEQHHRENPGLHTVTTAEQHHRGS